jgi:hypothetical protein
MKVRVAFLEKFYRAFLNEVCQDLPDCRELKKHAKKHGQKFVRSVLHDLRIQHPKVDLFLRHTEHPSAAQSLALLRDFHVNTQLLSDLQDDQMSPQLLQNLVHVLWEEIKTGLELHEAQELRSQSSQNKAAKKSRKRKKKAAPYASANSEPETKSWSDTLNPYNWDPKTRMLAAGAAALSLGGAAVMSGYLAPLVSAPAAAAASSIPLAGVPPSLSQSMLGPGGLLMGQMSVNPAYVAKVPTVTQYMLSGLGSVWNSLPAVPAVPAVPAYLKHPSVFWNGAF